MKTLALLSIIVVSALAGCGKIRSTPVFGAIHEHQDAAGARDAGNIVVARVNGAEITMDVLVKMMNRIGRPLNSDDSAGLQRTQKAALDQLILQELALQHAKAAHITVDPKLVDGSFDNFKENLGGEKEFAWYLSREKTTEADIRTQFERALVLQNVYQVEVAEKAVIAEDRLKQEYEREKHRYVIPEKLAVTDVYFLKPSDLKSGKRKAEAVREKIRTEAGGDPWKLILDGTFLVRSLDLNRQRHPELFECARKMKPGDVSDVISDNDGLHIMVLNSASPERQITFDEARKSIEGKYRASAEQKRLHEWKEELAQAAVIEIADEKLLQRKGPPRNTEEDP